MVGLDAVSLLVLTVRVGLLPVLVDIAPAEVGLAVMQLSRPAVCLGSPVVRLGFVMSCPLHVSVGPLLELGCAAYLLWRRTVYRLHAVVIIDMVVRVQLLRWCLRFFSWLGGTTIGFARTLEAPFASRVLVGSARWSSHTGQHRSIPGGHATAGAGHGSGGLEKRWAALQQLLISIRQPAETYAGLRIQTHEGCAHDLLDVAMNLSSGSQPLYLRLQAVRPLRVDSKPGGPTRWRAVSFDPVGCCTPLRYGDERHGETYGLPVVSLPSPLASGTPCRPWLGNIVR
jgi:hypothetical protein